jgi:predicted esterase
LPVSLLNRAPFRLALLVTLSALVSPGTARAAAPRLQRLQPAASAQAVPPHSLYLPTNAAARQPLQVLVAIHGMGGDGASFAAPLLAQAERNGWIVVAPTLAYGDWRDPEQVRRDDSTFLPQIKALIESLPARTGLQIRPGTMLYGFSRGGQMVHRFASFYPRSTLAVASFSCGTFTLPTRTVPDDPSRLLLFPYGLGDLERYTGRPLDVDGLRQVSFLIGVGARDTQSADVPRQWDPYVGTNRVERAQTYERALENLGARAQIELFPNSAHGESDAMRSRAMEFLANAAPVVGAAPAFGLAQ